MNILNQEEVHDDFLNKMAAEATANAGLMDFEDATISEVQNQSANAGFMDFNEAIISSVQNQMQALVPIPSTNQPTLAQGEALNKATMSNHPSLPNLDVTETDFNYLDNEVTKILPFHPYQQDTPNTVIQICWDMVDTTTRTGSIKQMVQMYKITKDPIIPTPTDPNTHIWKTINDIKEQIKQQVKKTTPTAIIDNKNLMAKPKVQKKGLQICRSISTQTDTIKPIIIRSSAGRPSKDKPAIIHSRMTKKSKFNRLQAIFTNLEAMETRREVTVDESRIKAQDTNILLRAVQSEVAKLTRNEDCKIIATYFKRSTLPPILLPINQSGLKR
jgi:hypothetical protein